MPIRAKAEYADPDNIPVTIVLTGKLVEFEELRTALGAAPYWIVRNLIDQICEASRALRGRAEARVPAARQMLPGDIGFMFHEERRRDR